VAVVVGFLGKCVAAIHVDMVVPLALVCATIECPVMRVYKFIQPFLRGGYGAAVIADSEESARTRLKAYVLAQMRDDEEEPDISWVDKAEVTCFDIERPSIIIYVES
jgi:hypothetical protein